MLRNTRNGTDVFTRFLHDLFIYVECVLVNLAFSHQTLVSLVRMYICTCVSRVLNVYLMIIFPNTYYTSHLYNIHKKYDEKKNVFPMRCHQPEKKFYSEHFLDIEFDLKTFHFNFAYFCHIKDWNFR